jgi:dihydroxyacid dehydratase/phosphogluconate dehydratase
MFTANSMNCLCEALGLALPGNGTILAGAGPGRLNPERVEFWKQSARLVLELVRTNLTPSKIITQAAFDNAVTLDMAMGGSTNTVLHLLAIAHEAGIAYDCRRIDAISRRTPCLARIAPNGSHHMEDVHYAGGIYAILGELAAAGLLDLSCRTVLGQTWADLVAVVKYGIHWISGQNILNANAKIGVPAGEIADEGVPAKESSHADRRPSRPAAHRLRSAPERASQPAQPRRDGETDPRPARRLR